MTLAVGFSESDMRKVSIIIPVYNVEQYIEKCIESVLKQSYENIEVLIVDDGSTDNSISLAMKKCLNDPRFFFFQKNNGGLSSARNFGLDHVTGDYICFLDSDDYIDPHFIKKMITEILTTNSDICMCNINMVNSDGAHIKYDRNDFASYTNNNDIFLCCNTITAYAWDKMYKRSLFDKMRYDENIKTYEDSQFTFRILYNRSLSHVNEALYNYVQRNGAITKSLPNTLLSDKNKVINAFYEFYDANKKNCNIQKHYLNFCYLKTMVLGPSIIIAKYSLNYLSDRRDLLFHIDSKKLSFKNIISIKKYSAKIMIALLLFKSFPRLFKYLISRNDNI